MATRSSIPAPSVGGKLSVGWAINDAGQILADRMTANGVERLVLLTPSHR